MTTYTPIAGIIPNYDELAGYWLKFYEPDTTTPVSMSIDDVGTTLLAKAVLDINGFPTTDGSTLFTPHMITNYDAFLFPTEAEADANDTINAFRVAENLFISGGGATTPTNVVFDADTVDVLINDSDLLEGQKWNVTEHTAAKGGAGVWNVVLSASVSTNTYDIVQCIGAPLLAIVLQAELPFNPRTIGLDPVASSLSNSEMAVNSGVLNFAFNKYNSIFLDMIARTYGEVFVKSSLTVTGENPIAAGILGYHPTEPTLTDITILAPDAQGNNTWNLILKNLDIQAINADKAIHMTPYLCVFENNRFRCPNGAAVKYHDGGYQVENKWQGNYFNGCLTGVEAFGGFRGPTDQFFVDNLFFSDGISEYHLRLSNCSGTLFSGNHYYGGNTKEYCRISFALNVRFIGEYHEENLDPNSTNNNAHITLVGGNPNSNTFSNCDFWKNDGSKVDYNGDATCSIKVTFSDFNPFKLSLTGCNFREGVNNLPIFGFTNGSSANTGAVNITFNDDNMVSGTYDLLKKLGTSAVAGNIVTTNHPQFTVVVTALSGDYVNNTGGEIYSTYNVNATSFPALPGSIDWLVNKRVIINNIATNTSLSFSAGGGLTIGGLNPVPVETRVAIIQDPTGTNDILIRRD